MLPPWAPGTWLLAVMPLRLWPIGGRLSPPWHPTVVRMEMCSQARMAAASEDCRNRLDIIALAGCPPRGLLCKLLSRGDAEGLDRSAAPGSTLIGLVSIR
jgi:hypothetical protein